MAVAVAEDFWSEWQRDDEFGNAFWAGIGLDYLCAAEREEFLNESPNVEITALEPGIDRYGSCWYVEFAWQGRPRAMTLRRGNIEQRDLVCWSIAEETSCRDKSVPARVVRAGAAVMVAPPLVALQASQGAKGLGLPALPQPAG